MSLVQAWAPDNQSLWVNICCPNPGLGDPVAHSASLQLCPLFHP